MSELETLVINTVESMSEPSDFAIDQFNQDATPESTGGGATDTPSDTVPDTDSDGKFFDPEQHAVTADGTPKRTQAGRWAKKRGRKSGSTVGGQTGPSEDQRAAMSGSATHQTGKAAAAMLITCGMLVSDEFQPTRDHASGVDERLMLESAFAEYFAAKDIDDIPPGVALSFAILAYIGPRLTQPKTQSRSKQFGNWIGQKWLKRKNKKAAAKYAQDIKAKEALKASATKNENKEAE